MIAFLAAVPSIRNGYAYDDGAIVATNPCVHTLAAWWHLFREPYWPASVGSGLYRPLQILSFAVQWTVRPDSPHAYHAVGVALYVAATVAVWWLARQLVSEQAAWVAAALFAVHPVHAEATGNLVGQAEILVALAVTVAAALYALAVRRGALDARTTVAIAALYATACFTKEHGVLLPALLVAIDVAVRPRAAHARGSWRERVRGLAPLAAALGLVAAAYLALRVTTPGVDTGDVFLRRYSMPVRLTTALGIIPQYVRLLVWPARLSADYTPPMVRIGTRWLAESTMGVALLAVAAWALARAYRHDRALFAALAWTAIALVVPFMLVIAGGVLLAERTMLLPSVGAALAAGALVDVARARGALRLAAPRRMATAALAFVLALGAWRTATRQAAWRDDQALWAQTRLDAPDSYAERWRIGDALVRNGRVDAGVRELRAAEAAYPTPEVARRLGSVYAAHGRYADAVPQLALAVREAPELLDARYELARSLAESGRADSARVVARALLAARAWRADTTGEWLRRIAGDETTKRAGDVPTRLR